MSKPERLTILADPVKDADIIRQLKGNGVSNEGRKLLRLAMLLDRAELVQPLTYLMETGVEEKTSPVELVKMSLDMVEMIKGQSTTIQPKEKPEPVKKPAEKLSSPFGAGSR